MSDFHIDAVEPADAPRLAALHAQAFAHPWSLGQIASGLRSAGAFCLAGRLAEEWVGFILCRAVASEAEILTLAVSPAARRRGLGRALASRALAHANLLGAKEIFLEVAVDNAPAKALYAALGFEIGGRRPAYYQNPGHAPTDALVMRRVLP